MLLCSLHVTRLVSCGFIACYEYVGMPGFFANAHHFLSILSIKYVLFLFYMHILWLYDSNTAE